MKPFQTKSVKIAVLLDNGCTSIMSFTTLGRGSALTRPDGSPVPGMLWVDQSQGIWARYDNDETIADEIAHTDFGAKPTSWQRVTDISLCFDRDYRRALRVENGKLVHDIVAARECKRAMIREARTAKLTALDVVFTRAQAREDKTGQDQAETERQKWRDAPADPRIEAAQTIEELKQIPLP